MCARDVYRLSSALLVKPASTIIADAIFRSGQRIVHDDLAFVENDSTRIFSTRSIVKMKAMSKRFVLRYVMQETLR